MRSVVIIITTIVLATATAAGAGSDTRFSARAGVEIAYDAARSWAEDARLVYIENDENVAPDGGAERWGYLFYSHRMGKARGYSVRNGKIAEAADLGFDFEAPPLPEGWIDSGPALATAERAAGAEYRSEYGGRLGTMLLIRGAFDERNPDASTWTFVYTSESEPSLFVVVDAGKGEVIRKWKG
jgi:hypothetical protein